MKAPTQHKHAYLILVLQVIFLVLFGVFVRYGPEADAKYHPASKALKEDLIKHEEAEPDGDSHKGMYPYFQDVHVMIFIGFGFLMTFLKKYGFGSVGINFLLGSMCLEWAILINGFFHLHDGMILVDLSWLLSADFVAAAVLISFGALLGKATPTQLIIMTLIEIPIFAINEVIGRRYLGAVDMGDSMFVHAFGAYFGLAVSLILNRPDVSTEKEGSCYHSDIFAMIGTVFLWVFWPSFNGGAAPGDDQHRAIINTYLSLAACCFTTFAVSSLVDRNKKFDMVHVQNSTLAGGVAIGTAADMMVQPWGAVLIGMIAGVMSVVGYTYLTPLIASKLRIHDTCGVHNLHGMPAILAGVIGAVMAAMASEDTYGTSVYEIFPALVPQNNTEELSRLLEIMPNLKPGPGISASTQGLYQILALLLTLGFAILGGVVTGFILRIEALNELQTEDLFEDEKFWLMEEGEEEETHVSPITDSGMPMTRSGQVTTNTK